MDRLQVAVNLDMGIYLRIEGKAEGPFSLADVHSRLGQGEVTPETPAWCVGWSEWKTVAEVLHAPAESGAGHARGEVPPPSPVAPQPVPPAYTSTIVPASLLFCVDVLMMGSGSLSMFVLLLGTPILIIRALLARKNRPLLRRRVASLGIYLVVTITVIVLVRADQKGARQRAGAVVSACETFKQARGEYPKALAELVPQYLPAVPPARKLGVSGRHDFQYFQAGPNQFTSGTNLHVLLYVAIPPFGKSYYVLEEKKWGFYD